LLVQQPLTQDRLARECAAMPDLPVVQAMAYAVKGGKGLRGFLVMESAALHGVDAGRAIAPAAAIEALHAYSLVHDDLPCMDDDDLRRGQPTVHRKWDEATAVLAGDALQTLAFSAVCCVRCGPCRGARGPRRVTGQGRRGGGNGLGASA
jgi:farnesyl diphosphate synthase